MTISTEPEDSDPPAPWRLLGQWWFIVVVSLGLLAATLNPIAAGLLPYVKAGWPAARTAFWLKSEDPWKARGTVGLLFHLCMAFFRAGTVGLIWVLLAVFAAAAFHEEPDMVLFIVAILTILFGCLLSTVLCWVGILIALRHHVRIFVFSNLYKVCRGHFSSAGTLESGPLRINPGNYIIAIATVTPMLALWFVAMLLTMPGPGVQEIGVPFQIVFGMLPVLCIVAVAVIVYLSKQIAARSPAECWGQEAPEQDSDENDRHWYHD